MGNYGLKNYNNGLKKMGNWIKQKLKKTKTNSIQIEKIWFYFKKNQLNLIIKSKELYQVIFSL